MLLFFDINTAKDLFSYKKSKVPIFVIIKICFMIFKHPYFDFFNQEKINDA